MQPFANIPPIPKDPREILEPAFNRAMRMTGKERIKAIEKARRREATRIRYVGMYVKRRLRRIAYSYPRLDEIHPFLP